MRDLAAGALLDVLATDPTTVRDFQTFCRQTGNPLLEWREGDDGVYRFLIQKGG